MWRTSVRADKLPILHWPMRSCVHHFWQIHANLCSSRLLHWILLQPWCEKLCHLPIELHLVHQCRLMQWVLLPCLLAVPDWGWGVCGEVLSLVRVGREELYVLRCVRRLRDDLCLPVIIMRSRSGMQWRGYVSRLPLEHLQVLFRELSWMRKWYLLLIVRHSKIPTLCVWAEQIDMRRFLWSEGLGLGRE